MALLVSKSPACGAGRGSRLRGAGARVRSVTVMRGDGKFVVGGNWKCNGTRDSIKQLVADLNAAPPTSDVEIICSPPFVYLDQVVSTLGKRYGVAAQNSWVAGLGAYTGEIADEMILDVGAAWVILGHSERRALCGETSEMVGKKVQRALSKGLNVIVCVGETLAQREAGTTMSVIFSQLAAVAAEISEWSNVVIAYEPVWAIGTGKVATPEQAQEVHKGIRSWMAEKVSADVATAVRIQYGGSVTSANCLELAAQEDIDGFLVGGASLKAADFLTICASADAHYAVVKRLLEEEKASAPSSQAAGSTIAWPSWLPKIGV